MGVSLFSLMGVGFNGVDGRTGNDSSDTRLLNVEWVDETSVAFGIEVIETEEIGRTGRFTRTRGFGGFDRLFVFCCFVVPLSDGLFNSFSVASSVSWRLSNLSCRA